MLNSIAVSSSTLYLCVGNPTLYDGNNAVPVGVGTPPLDTTTALWKMMVSFYLQNLFEKNYQSWFSRIPAWNQTYLCIQAEQNIAYMQQNIEPFPSYINQLTASEVTCLGEISQYNHYIYQLQSTYATDTMHYPSIPPKVHPTSSPNNTIPDLLGSTAKHQHFFVYCWKNNSPISHKMYTVGEIGMTNPYVWL